MTPVSVFLAAALLIGSALLPSASAQIDATTYANLVHYAHFASASYIISSTGSSAQCKPQGATVTTYFSDGGTDTQGYIARDDSRKEFVVAFRGSTSVTDYLEDANIIPDLTFEGATSCDLRELSVCYVHSGFYNSWHAVEGTITSALASQRTGSYASYGVVVTGHSLGGAVAAFATLKLKGTYSSIKGYTYGQPRIGESPFANYFDSTVGTGNFFRVTHVSDSIPQMVPSSIYHHHSTEYYQTSTSSSASAIKKCNGQEDSTCNISAGSPNLANLASLIGSGSPHHTYVGVSMGDAGTC